MVAVMGAKDVRLDAVEASQAEAARLHLPERLVRVLRDLPRLAIAYSGGLDSRFLCHAAQLCHCDVLALHACGPHIPSRESAKAQTWARRRGLNLICVEYSPLRLPEVAQMTKKRCYACKKGLIALLRQELSQRGEDRTLCDGSNADDMRAFRPGLKALAEGNVRSPLAEADLGKTALRAAARDSGLDQPEQRARSCLLTRFAYGHSPDLAMLKRLEAVEVALEGLSADLGDFRLRLTPAPLLQAQHLPADALRPLRVLLQRHGFTSCALMESAQVSGWYDQGSAGPMPDQEVLDFSPKIS